MEIIKILILAIFAHCLGDYVLQVDFIAQTKGKNWYHLIIHCILYTFAFYMLFGLTWHLSIIFITHLIIDPIKARYNKITYTKDQVLHYLITLIYLI